MKELKKDRTASQVAEWMLDTLKHDRYVDYKDVITRLQLSENDKFLHKNAKGVLSIDKEVLDEFRRLTGDTVIWDEKEKYWRKNEIGKGRPKNATD
jgi:hypothetical protein